MIDLAVGEDLELLGDTARSFAAEHLAPGEREHETEREVSAEVRRLFDAIGLARLELPEALGGAELGAVARVLVLEELAAADVGAALALDPLGPALYPLAELAGDASLAGWLEPLLAEPGRRAVLAWLPDAGVPEPGARLSLALPWEPCDRVDLLVGLGPEGAFAVRDGIATTKLKGAGLRAAGAAAIELESAPVVASWRDPAGAARALARARVYVTALLTGVMRSAAEFSRGYALERVAFGKPIAHHQALAFLVTDMHAAVEGVRMLAWEAAWRLDAGLDAAGAAAGAFAEANEQGVFVGANAVQILGGHGFMQDYPVEKRMREARALGLLLGGLDAAREDAAAAITVGDAPLLALEGA